METFIVVVLISIIVLATIATAWYSMRNINHLRQDTTEADLKWRRDRGLM